MLEGAGKVGWVGATRSENERNYMMCRNVCDGCKDGSGMDEMREVHDMRAEAIHFYSPDVVMLVENWTTGYLEEMVVEDYRWFGRHEVTTEARRRSADENI